MLKRPSSRRKSGHSEIALNLVPILDTMVTLIGFLLFTMSVMAVVTIESPFPQTSPEQVEKKLNEKPLQLTLSISDVESELWSPFDKFPARKVAHASPGIPDTAAIHKALIELKQSFPDEHQIVFVPPPGMNYDTIITVMDALRTVEPSDPPVFRKNKETGVDEAVKTLFPEIVFGNLLGDG